MAAAVHLRRQPGCADLLALAARAPQRYPGFLDSAVPGRGLGRWSILFACPQDVIALHADGSTSGTSLDAFLPALDAAWQRERIDGVDGSLPFRGGWLLLLCHELATELDPALRLPAADVPAIPVALAIRCPAAILVDHVAGQTWLMAEAAQAHLLDVLAADLAADRLVEPEVPRPTRIEEDEPERFLAAVAAVQRHIAAGEVSQVNLGRRWRAHFEQAPEAAALYAALRAANPAPFAGLLQHADWAIASSSPERLVEVRGTQVRMRPIAGTCARGAAAEDAARMALLHDDPKERAEHLLLLDLVRDDLSAACVDGTVHSDEFMAIETHAHVHHIVSSVRGRLPATWTPGHLLSHIFPGGSITGAPKRRCLQIIAAQEGRGRGPYTGALGYLSRDGNLDLNVLIRSMVIHDRCVDVHAGAGIIAQSQPAAELAETRAKARGVLRALGDAS